MRRWQTWYVNFGGVDLMRKIKWLSWVGTKCVYPKTRVAWVFGILKSSTLLYWQNMGDVYKLVQILVHKVLKTRYFPNADFLSAWGTIHLYLEKHYVCTISGSTRYSLAGGQWPVHQRMQWQMVEPTINFLSYLQTCYGTYQQMQSSLCSLTHTQQLRE